MRRSAPKMRGTVQTLRRIPTIVGSSRAFWKAEPMKALVKYAAADGALEVRALPEPVAGPGTVLVRLHTVGVCGTDIHRWLNTQSNIAVVVLPVPLGHESAGVIAAVGEGVTGWAVGDRVVCQTAA